jgi:hypothetical protein
MGYCPFSLWVIHKEGLCPSSGDINRLMMMMMMNYTIYLLICKLRPCFKLYKSFTAVKIIIKMLYRSLVLINKSIIVRRIDIAVIDVHWGGKVLNNK